MKLLWILLGLLVFAWPTQAQLRWIELGRMQAPRSTAQSELLSANSMIVMGGWTQWPATTATTDIIDAERRTILPGPGMNVARADFASVSMPNGDIVVLGGYTSGYEVNTDVVEVYSPQTGSFRIIGQLSMPRGQLAAIALDSESILVVGGRAGWSNVTARCEIFYPRIGATKLLPDFPYVTSHSRLIRTKDNRILAFSGRSGGPGSYRSDRIHEFVPASQTWIPVGSVADSVWLPTITELPGREYFWTGGSTREADGVQDFSNTIGQLIGSTFNRTGRMIVDRVWHGAVSLSDSLVIVVGGAKEDGGSYSTTELIDPRFSTSMPGPTCNVPHAKASTVGLDVFGRRTVVVAGGVLGSGTTDVVEMLVDNCLDGTILTRLDTSQVRFDGKARVYGSTIVLSGPETRSAGSIWLKDKRALADGFSSTIVFRLSEGDDHQSQDGSSPGADGLALVIQAETPAITGGIGQGIGYEGVPHGLAIEIDSYHNPTANDPPEDHVAVQIGNGLFLSSQHKAPFIRAMADKDVPSLVADGRRYYAKVEYANAVLKVWFDRTGKFEHPVLETGIDIVKDLSLSSDGSAFIGISSATGLSSQLHEVEDWSFSACDAILVGVSDRTKLDGVSTDFIISQDADHSIQVRSAGVCTIGNWQLIDNLGRMMQSGQQDGFDMTVDLNRYPAGAYILVVGMGTERTLCFKVLH